MNITRQEISDRQPGEKAGPLVFVHIPKCSGTSFERYLTGAYEEHGVGTSCYTGVNPKGEFEDLSAYIVRSSESPFLFGHIRYCDVREHLPSGLFMTFLRDPIQRTISQYKSWHDPKNFTPSDPHYKKADSEVRAALEFAQNASLEEFVTSTNAIVRANALGNLQTLMLSSYRDAPMEAHLDSAMRNLESFDFIGITERFFESIDLFRAIFRDAPKYTVSEERENRSRVSVGEVSPQIEAVIRDQVKYDLLLFDYATELFDQRVQSASVGGNTCSLYALAPSTEKTGLMTGAANVGAEVSGAEVRLLRSEVSRLKDEKERVEQDLHSRTLAHDEEKAILLGEIDHLRKSYAELSDLYQEVVRSKTWRVASGMSSMFARLIGK